MVTIEALGCGTPRCRNSLRPRARARRRRRHRLHPDTEAGLVDACTRSMRSTGHSAECRRRKVHRRPEGGRPPRPLPTPDPSTPWRLRALDGKRVRRPDSAATVADGAVVPESPDCRSSARMEQVRAFPSSYHGDGGGHSGLASWPVSELKPLGPPARSASTRHVAPAARTSPRSQRSRTRSSISVSPSGRATCTC